MRILVSNLKNWFNKIRICHNIFINNTLSSIRRRIIMNKNFKIKFCFLHYKAI